MKHPPTRCIAVDVDGTLVIDGAVNPALTAAAKRAKDRGIDVVLWSARGRKYAEMIAARYDVTDCFTAIVGKPGFIVDDKGWKWIKYTKALSRADQMDLVSLNNEQGDAP